MATSQVQQFSLRLVFSSHIRFTAKSSAPLGSSCQSRLCSSARRIPQNRAVLASAPSGSAPLRRLTAPPSAVPLAIYETNVFYWPAKAQLIDSLEVLQMLEIPRTLPGHSEPRLLGVREAATYLGSTVWAIRTLVWEEQVPHIKIGKRLLIDRADLDKFVDQHKILPTSVHPPSRRGNKPLLVR